MEYMLLVHGSLSGHEGVKRRFPWLGRPFGLPWGARK